MSGLVTDAAIDAALNAWYSGLEHYRGEVKQRLALIADLIAAEALRQAERRIAERWETAEKGPEWLEGLARGALIVQKCIDELEGE